jgi:hypothetical protein
MIIQRLFSSKEQKARRAKFDLSQHKIASKENAEESKKLLETLHKSGKHDIDSAITAVDKHFKRYRVKEGVGGNEANKSDLNLRKSKLSSKKILGKEYNSFGFTALGAKPNTDIFKKEAEEDFNKGLRDAPGASEKKKKLAEKVDKYEKKEAEKAAKSKASIAKHEAKAAELRAKKEAGEQLKKNLKKGGKIALATGGVVAAGIGAKKLADKKKAKKEEKK